MPITFLPNPNGPVLGPGIRLQWSSDFIGPLPSGTEWRVILEGQAGEQGPWIIATEPTQQPTNGIYIPLVPSLNTTWNTSTNIGLTIGDGTQARANVELRTPTGVIDSGTLQATWDAQSGVPFQISNQATATGGFTAQDRQNLQTTTDRTSLLGEVGELVVETASGPIPATLAQLFSRNSLDRLIFEEMTSGPTCEPVRIVLAPIAQFAITVRVTQVPVDITFKTPDQEWAFPDLAVLRIFRGEDLIYRRGIHEVSFETDAPWAWGANFLDKNLLGIPPPQTQVMVDWRPGVCGQVFIRHMP